MSQPSGNKEAALHKDVKVAEFLGSFREVAQYYGQKIIDEYHLKSISKQGEKQPGTWLHGQILFYLASDFDDESLEQIESSFRKTSLELLGINSVNKHQQSDLHTALMCLIDYKGFRLVAYAVMPLEDKKTLVLEVAGDEDDGPVVDVTALEKVNEVGKLLNLKDHQVDLGNGKGVGLRVSANVEVHYCQKYDHYYVLNLCDLYPLDIPKAEISSAAMDNQKRLRPEFVQVYKNPLSPDAFSSVTAFRDRQHNDKEVIYAARFLRENHIPSFVKKLDDLEILPIDSRGFTNELHKHGINIRHLGLVARHTKLPYIKEMCFIEMIARSCKVLFRDQIRRAIINFRKIEASKIEDELRNLAIKLFNNVLGNGDGVKKFWEEKLKVWIHRKFSFNMSFETFSNIHQPAMFISMQYHCGMNFQDSMDYDFGSVNPIKQHHFINFSVRIKSVEGLPSKVESKSGSSDYFKSEEEKYVYDLARHLAMLGQKAKLTKSDVTASKFNNLARYFNSVYRYDEANTYGLAANNLACKNQAGTSLIYINLLETTFMLSAQNHKDSTEIEEQFVKRSPRKSKSAQSMSTVSHSSSHSSETLSSAGGAGSEFSSSTMTLSQPKTSMHTKLNVILDQYERGLNILEFHWGEDHPLAINLHDKISQLFCRINLNQKGYEYHKRALQLAYRILGKNHAVTARHLLKSGYILHTLNRISEALSTFTEALQIFQSLPNCQVHIAETHYCLASSYEIKGDLDTAINHSQSARKIREKLWGPLHALTAESYLQLANLVLASYADYQGVITPQIKASYQLAITCFEKVFKFYKSKKNGAAGKSPQKGGFNSNSQYSSLNASTTSFLSRLDQLSAANGSMTSLLSHSTANQSSISLAISQATGCGAPFTTNITSSPTKYRSSNTQPNPGGGGNNITSKTNQLLMLTRQMISLKFKILQNHQKELLRAARYALESTAEDREEQQADREKYEELTVKDVILKLVHLTPIVYLEDVLARINDGEEEANFELKIIVQIVESNSISIAG
ncbi:clustered mitochondria-domain-containing protein [Paraphysoderma sedebokerense]|nr:clustered mitochondria-domain-containing protein [Paraphysoderma sedebokerense]